jgi:hypothetical protein
MMQRKTAYSPWHERPHLCFFLQPNSTLTNTLGNSCCHLEQLSGPRNIWSKIILLSTDLGHPPLSSVFWHPRLARQRLRELSYASDHGRRNKAALHVEVPSLIGELGRRDAVEKMGGQKH